MEFMGKNAIVTGAGKGIGLAIAGKLAKEGAFVALVDWDGEAAAAAAAGLRAQGYQAEGYKVDVSNVGQIRAFVEQITAQREIHILVNNAGIYGTKPVQDITEEDWDRENSINLKGQFFFVQALAEGMMARGYGKIVNLSSVAGRNGGVEAGMTYAASKSGVIGMTRGLAARLASYGVNVNCVAPGPTLTDMFKKLSEEQREKVRLGIPLKKFGTAEDIAEAVTFLASDRAGFITGAVLDVNGGMYMG